MANRDNHYEAAFEAYLRDRCLPYVAVDETKAKQEVIDKAYDDLSKGGVWSVNDGMPQKLIDYTIGKEIEVGTIKADPKPTYEQVIDTSIVQEAIQRNGGPWSGDPRWY